MTFLLRFSALLSLLVALPALAEDPQAAGGAPPIVVVEQGSYGAQAPPTPERHGLYLRVGLGVGALTDDMEGPFWTNGSASGPSGAFELAVGGTVGRGWILGGAIVAEWVQNPTVEVNGLRVDDNTSVGALGMIGPFLNWYPGSDNSGFYLSAMIGGARITIEDESGGMSSHEPVGGGGAIAAGYEFLLGTHLALGIMLRLTGATLSDESITHNVGAGSLLAALSWY